jgi:hypothetical protein
MNKKEFYQEAMIAALNGLLSANGNAYEPEYLQPYATVAAMAHEYAKALTIQTFNQLDSFEDAYDPKWNETVI